MSRTLTVLLFFVAAVLAGMFVKSGSPLPVISESFAQREKGMPLDMGPVAGYTGTSPILGSEPRPLSEKPYDMANDNELFMFSGNKMGSDCCPSPFSGDRGCICLTDAQKSEFSSRGGNRS